MDAAVASPATKSVGQPAASKTGGTRRLRLALPALVLFSALAVWGLVFDRSIRPDPFDPSPDLGAWFFHTQPHPALRRMPLVPVGWRGLLTPRPSDTAWINSPWLPPGPVAADPRPPALSLIFPAKAGEDPAAKAPPPAPVRPLPYVPPPPDPKQQTPVQQSVEPPALDLPILPEAPPGAAPRLLAVAVSPDGQQVWAGGDGGLLFRSADGGRTWAEAETGLDVGSIFAIDAGGRTIQAMTTRRWTLTSPSGFSWSGRRGVAEAEGLFLTGREEASLWYYAIGDATEPEPSPIYPLLSVRRDSLGPRIALKPRSIALRRDSGVISAAFVATSQGRIEVAAVETTTDWWSGATALVAAVAAANGPPAGINAAAARESTTGPLTVWFAGDGGALARVTLPRDPKQPPTVVNAGGATRANLRSVYLQPDGRVGWAASAWFDGNEEGARPAVLQTTDGGDSWQRLSYRHLPAPWLLYFVLPGLLAAGYGTVTGLLDARRSRRLRPSVADEASSDRPIAWEDRDALGLKPIAHALSKFLRNRNTDPPVTFAVTGPWGSGKSSLLNLVADDLRDFDCRPVWFNAWHHQKEDHLLAALLANIRSQAPPPWWRFSGIDFRARLFVMRSGRLLAKLLSVALLATAALAILHFVVGDAPLLQLWTRASEVNLQDIATKPLDQIVGGLLGGLTALGSIGVVSYWLFMLLMRLQVISLDPAKLMGSLRGSANASAMRDQLSFRHRFACEFGEVCRALRAGGRAGMVIIIDDLDRCRPENVLEILEAVNFLTTAGPCFIILGIDEEKVISAVASGFRDSILTLPREDDPNADDDLRPDAKELAAFSRSYMEKLINIPIPVPMASAATSCAILNAESDPAPPASPWPRRMRAGARDAIDVMGAVAVVGGLAAAVLFGGQFMHTGTTPVVASAPASPGAAAAGEEPNAGAPEDAAEAEASAPGADAPPAVAATDVSAAPWWLHATPLWVALATVLGLGALRLLALREEEVEDSIDFRDALRIWSPVIFAGHPTPRGVKRYQNRLRYLAMRARGDDRAPGWIDRLFGGDGPAPTALDLPEPTLVALGALSAYDRGLLDALGVGSAPPLVQRVVAEFGTAFPGLWPPTADQVGAFRAIGGELRR